ncbi:MAG: hypothetical protein NC078_00080 [Ruminococcus sp.]|nr:hypothetical protein [Ruminococcus sp.]
MNMKKIISGAVAGAMAMSMCAVSAFAATVEMDSEYPGSWAASACIPKTELEAIGGNVKITLTVETRNLANTADQFLIRPMDFDNGWADLTPECTSDTVIAKTDGMFCIPEEATTVEFVLNGSAVAGLGDSGVSFQCQNVTVKSAELEAGSPQAEFPRVSDADGKDYCFGRKTFEELGGGAAAPAEEEETVDEVAEAEAAPVETEAAVTEAAPQADTASATTPAQTGNTPAVAIAFVMVAAGAAAVISKRK